jgi:hypothetical protein
LLLRRNRFFVGQVNDERNLTDANRDIFGASTLGCANDLLDIPLSDYRWSAGHVVRSNPGWSIRMRLTEAARTWQGEFAPDFNMLAAS